MEKIYKSRKNKVLTGLFGGLGEHFEIDPSLIRVIWLFLVFFTGFVPGILFYIFASLVIPNKPKQSQ